MRHLYHQNVGRYFGLTSDIPFARTSIWPNDIAATVLNSGTTGTGWTVPIPTEDAYIVSTQLKPLVGNELWVNGRRASAGGFATGEIGVVNLGERPQAYLPNAYAAIQFHVPRRALNELPDRTELTPVSELRFESNDPNPALHGLMEAALSRIGSSTAGGRLFFDQIVLAALMHLARRYGGARKRRSSGDSALSRWQLERAKELLRDDLTQEISLDSVAAFCGMSTDRFTRSFKLATGMPPYRWLKLQRLEQAQAMIRENPDRSLTGIAHECGFADSSHMTRNFVSELGLSPGRWRSLLAD